MKEVKTLLTYMGVFTLTYFFVVYCASASVFYIDAEASMHHKDDDVYVREGRNFIKWRNILLSIEAGYTTDKTSVFIKHTSSAQAADRGINEIGIRHRMYEW